jgi:chemotaxis protein histidine kinase CheA
LTSTLTTNERIRRDEECKRKGHAQIVEWRLSRNEEAERLKKKLASNELKRGKERERRTQMSDSIRILSTLIPQSNTTAPPTNKKLSHAEVMRLTIEYIRHLQQTVEQLKAENRMLRELYTTTSTSASSSLAPTPTPTPTPPTPPTPTPTTPTPTAPHFTAPSSITTTTTSPTTTTHTDQSNPHTQTKLPSASSTSDSLSRNSSSLQLAHAALQNVTVIPTVSNSNSTPLSPSLSSSSSSPSPSPSTALTGKLAYDSSLCNHTKFISPSHSLCFIVVIVIVCMCVCVCQIPQ